ncbi:MAG: FMN-binding protein [Mobilitalea sp.]
MKKFFKWTGIVLLVLTIIMMIYAFLGKEEVLKLNIETVDLSQIPDGTYIGSYDNYRWSNKVEVTITKHKITAIKFLKIQDGRNGLIKDLTKNILDQQTPDVDVISGATASSNGYLKAVETALRSAENNNP